MPVRPDLRDGLPAGRPLRLVAVHAHPDDETLATGLALAHHVEAGDDVHVVTCTLGEEGEVITPSLAALEGDGPALAAHRRGELDRAMRRLGVEHHVLGGARPRWRDSGMAGSSAAAHPRAFAGAEVEEAARVLADLLQPLRADLVLTYDPWGGYAHPDHVQTHRVTARAVELLTEESPGAAPRLYVALVPASWAREDRRWLAAHVPDGARSPAGGTVRVPETDDPLPPNVVADDLVTHAVVDEGALPRQRAALAEHPTQVTLHEGWYTLSNDVAARLPGREGYAAWPASREALTRAQGEPPA
ncbi:N-acetyl-1-D-myo-inositol-2-amino-2-deoxy-alpha-D-glucopyranoside deacetylase [uncultured Serinicoccus sp.]|uniref:N-acetyl-1-D-myo-inositol-2-amino-2-deoxy-alpha- D-glucopyranoside deacetylase n=1 Tax=uncultured Serinicoccus sp. TaxID=735514 RepID=UPI002612FAF9|nr:N-acetyl-1-D-myo-inositol-2-amino-2-deoxy-alpha-D-glucopyranoside deacetylase [uncultured Serinicoccus sp.]